MNPTPPISAPGTPDDLSSAEIRWLRKYGWLLSLAGILAGLWIGAELWRAVLLDPNAAPADWLTPYGVALGLVLGALPLLWRLGIAWQRRSPSRLRRGPVAPLLAVAAVLLAEGLFRAPLSQTVFWQAVRVRAGHQRHLTREISLLRLDAANMDPHPRPGLVVVGSSQLVYGIDYPELAAQTGLPTYRRAVAGLFPTELVASQAWSDFHPDNRLVLMLSGFDMGARRDLVPDAIRPLATPSGMHNLIAAAEVRTRLRLWRSLVDLSLASVCDLWRSRDYARFLLEHPFQVSARPSAADAATLANQKDAYRQLGANPRMVDWCQRALERFFAEMSGRCREIVVFEGRIRPTYSAIQIEGLSRSTRDFLFDQQRKGFIRFVPLEEQALDLPEARWRDHTHVDAAGRRMYTEMFARVLAAQTHPPE